jgi:hypothetical protein
LTRYTRPAHLMFRRPKVKKTTSSTTNFDPLCWIAV